MTENSLNNDRFPTDPHTLLLTMAACAALTQLLPTDQLQAFTGLFSLIVPLLPRRR